MNLEYLGSHPKIIYMITIILHKIMVDLKAGAQLLGFNMPIFEQMRKIIFRASFVIFHIHSFIQEFTLTTLSTDAARNGELG